MAGRVSDNPLVIPDGPRQIAIFMSEVERGDLLVPEGAIVLQNLTEVLSSVEPRLHRLVVSTIALDGDVVVGEQLSNIDRPATDLVTVVRGLPTIKDAGQSVS